jgi:hypothetical protein
MDSHQLYDVLVETLRESLIRTRDLEVENQALRNELRSRGETKKEEAEASPPTHSDDAVTLGSHSSPHDASSASQGAASELQPHESAAEDDEQSPPIAY